MEFKNEARTENFTCRRKEFIGAVSHNQIQRYRKQKPTQKTKIN